MGAKLLSGQGAQEERQEVPASEKAQGKACAVEALPLEMVQHLQREEQEAERAWRGQDAATLAVVREVAGPLMQGQVEGLGTPS